QYLASLDAPSNHFQSHATGMADADGYYQIPTDKDQLDTLPWSGLSDMRLAFREDVEVAGGDLMLVGTDAGEVTATGFDYETETRTATWTFPAFETDKFLLALSDTVTATGSGLPLDGDYTDGDGQSVSGDGTPGGDFQFRFNVLPGDATNSGNVVAGDVSMLASAFGSFAGGSDGRYSPFVDFDGSGNVVAGDVSILASHFGRFLPGDEPVVPEGEGTAAAGVGTTSVSGVPGRAPETATVVADHERAPEAGLMLPGQGVIGRNPTTPADVNGDGYVSSIDALLVIRYLNDPATARPSAVPDTSPFYFDVNGDGTVSPSDALRVIAHLNSERSGTVDGEGEETASRRLVSDQRADAPPDGGTDQPLAAVPMPTVSVADGRSIDFSLQRQVSSDMTERAFSTIGDDGSLEQDNIEMSALLDGNRSHSPRRMAASIPINPASERTRRESENAVDRYFEDLDDAGDGVSVILDNLEILFDTALQMDPLRLLKSVSRKRGIVASWNGTIGGNSLTYAEPDHPEYRLYRDVDVQTVALGAQGAAQE
ncbi:MAG: BREX-3 system P-loop-containing protein BrxF, partial [Pirellulaceae bacterium]